jgi:hypothetical protein
MIVHKLFKHWKVDGNFNWKSGRLDETEDLLRDPGEETLEQELFRLNPDAWRVVTGEDRIEPEKSDS